MSLRTFWQRVRAEIALHLRLGRHIKDLRAGLAQVQQQQADDSHRVRADLAQLQQHYADLDHRLRALDASLAWLRQNHDGQAAWLQQVYPELAAAIGRKIEAEQLQAHTESLFAALHRELASIRAAGSAGTSVPAAAQGTGPRAGAVAVYDDIDPAFYPALEQRFRGTRAGVAARQQPYLVYLEGLISEARPLLDIGSGRGEWLQLLKDRQLSAQGIDLNPANAAACRAAGLSVMCGDAIAHLVAQPDASLGAITAFQVVEHLTFPQLQALLAQAVRVLAPGGVLVLETPNPENLRVATHSFWLDPTHVRPLPPELLEFAAQYHGFETLAVLRLNPDHDETERAPDAGADPFELRQRLYGPRDYALVARRKLVAPAATPVSDSVSVTSST